ncbi:anaerobic ribonucleoside-triphosphate reductase [Escherichia coli]
MSGITAISMYRITTNTPIDECYECGFTVSSSAPKGFHSLPESRGNHDASRVSVTRRVCGYLGSPDARPFNACRQAGRSYKCCVKHLETAERSSIFTLR